MRQLKLCTLLDLKNIKLCQTYSVKNFFNCYRKQTATSIWTTDIEILFARHASTKREHNKQILSHMTQKELTIDFILSKISKQ